MKRTFAIILILLLTLCFFMTGCTSIFATSGECGENVTWSYEDGVLSFHGSGDMMLDYGTEWGPSQPWNRFCGKITQVKMDDGITSVGYSAFYGCHKLTNVELSPNITLIENIAFAHCDALREVRLPNGLREIRAGAFSGCSSLRDITIPETVTSIEIEAFEDVPKETLAVYAGVQYASSASNPYFAAVGILEYDPDYEEVLRKGIVHDDTRVICDRLFSDAYGIETASIGSKVTNIGYGLGSSVRDLRRINVSEYNEHFCSDGRALFELDHEAGTAAVIAYAWNSGDAYDIPRAIFRGDSEYTVTEIRDWVFSGVKRLKAVTIPDTVTILENGAFSHCDSLRNVVIPGSIESIPYGAFDGCDALERVVIQEGVREIGGSAFEECRELTEVYLPLSIRSIKGRAFFPPNKELVLNYAGTPEQWSAVEVETDSYYDWKSRRYIRPEYTVNYLARAEQA